MSPARPAPARHASLGSGAVWSDVSKPIPHFGTDVPYSNKLSNTAKEQTVTTANPANQVADKPDSDPVNHPSHYTHGGIEVIDFLEAYFPTDPLLWQVGKYTARAGHKDPSKTLQDLEKAEFYLKRRIAQEKARA